MAVRKLKLHKITQKRSVGEQMKCKILDGVRPSPHQGSFRAQNLTLHLLSNTAFLGNFV